MRQYAADDAGALARLTPPGGRPERSRRARWPPLTGATSTSSTSTLTTSRSTRSPATARSRPRRRPVATRHDRRLRPRRSPDGRHAYVANQGDNTIGVYRVGTDGGAHLGLHCDSRADAPGAGRARTGREQRLRHERHVAPRSRSSTSAANGSLSPKTPASVPAGRTGGGHRGEPRWRQRLRGRPGRQWHASRSSRSRADGTLSALDPALVPSRLSAGGRRRHRRWRVRGQSRMPTRSRNTTAGSGGALAPSRPDRSPARTAPSDSPWRLAATACTSPPSAPPPSRSTTSAAMAR